MRVLLARTHTYFTKTMAEDNPMDVDVATNLARFDVPPLSENNTRVPVAATMLFMWRHALWANACTSGPSGTVTLMLPQRHEGPGNCPDRQAAGPRRGGRRRVGNGVAVAGAVFDLGMPAWHLVEHRTKSAKYYKDDGRYVTHYGRDGRGGTQVAGQEQRLLSGPVSGTSSCPTG